MSWSLNCEVVRFGGGKIDDDGEYALFRKRDSNDANFTSNSSSSSAVSVKDKDTKGKYDVFVFRNANNVE